MNKRWGEEGIGTSDLICIRFFLDVFRTQIFVMLSVWLFNCKIITGKLYIFIGLHFVINTGLFVLPHPFSHWLSHLKFLDQVLGFVVSMPAIDIWCFSVSALETCEGFGPCWDDCSLPLSILPGDRPSEWDRQNSCLSIDSRNIGKV